MSQEAMQEALARNVRSVQTRIAAAAERAGRHPSEVQLVAVSKTVEPARVIAAYDLGLRVFGENRVEEAEEKIPAVRAELARQGREPPSWHMIGHLQSRKSGRALELFDLIHAVDSVRLAERLSRQAREAGKQVPALLELNISGEESKYGFPAELAGSVAAQAPALFAAVAEILALPGLDVRGLMTMAPIVPTPEGARPYFRRLHEWREALRDRFPTHSWPELSMGMTDDFEVAVEEGATMVRIGRAIFACA